MLKKVLPAHAISRPVGKIGQESVSTESGRHRAGYMPVLTA